MARRHRDAEFSSRLYALMRDRNVDATWLGEHTGLNPATIYYYLEDQRAPNLVTLRLLKDALICTWDELLGG